MKTNRVITLSNAIFERLSNDIPSDFTGFGVVIYRGDFEELPTIPLIKESKIDPPLNQDLLIADQLISISRYTDYRHDGFHFVDEFLGLTNLAQYIAPSIPNGYEPVDYFVGARFRTAELVSMLDGIEAVLIVEKCGNIIRLTDGRRGQNE